MIRLGLAARLVRLLYSSLYLPASPLVLAYWLARPDSRRRLGEYLGGGARELPRGGDPPHPLWVHAVSVGETVAALPVLRRLAEHENSFFLTTTIDDAQQVAARRDVRFQGSCFLPLDLAWCHARLIEHVRPRAVLVSETDLWPNFLLELGRRGIPAYLVNGRLSPGVSRLWRLARVLGAPALSALRLAFVQGDRDAARLEAMGYPSEQIVVAGNTKYELGDPPPLPEDHYELRERVMGLERPVIVAGSTHAPEEEYLLDALKGAPGPAPLLVLVPRAPARAEEVRRLAATRKRRVGLWSELSAIQGDPAPYDVLVVDVMGILSGLYEMGQVAYVGGGFGEAGGHNFLEAAWQARPVLGGPNWKNFQADVEAFCEVGAMQVCADRDEVQDVVWSHLEDPEGARAAARRAREVLEQNNDASRIIAERLLADLERVPGPFLGETVLT